MPGLVLIACDVLLALRVADYEAVLMGVFCQPCRFGSCSEGVVDGIAVDDQSRLMLGITGACGIGVRHICSVALDVVVIYDLLIVV